VDELVLVVGRRHPWARSREVAPAHLAEELLLVREEGSATRQVTERTLERAGVRWRVGMELNHTEAIKQAVMAGLGVAVSCRRGPEPSWRCSWSRPRCRRGAPGPLRNGPVDIVVAIREGGR